VTTTTWISQNAPGYTSTVEAQGTTSGSVVVGSPSAGTQTGTAYWSQSTKSTSTVATASNSQSGSVIVFYPSAGYTTTTSYVSGQTGTKTTTLATATDASTGTVLIIDPAAGYSTSTTYWGSAASTTTLVTASANQSGFVKDYRQSAGTGRNTCAPFMKMSLIQPSDYNHILRRCRLYKYCCNSFGLCVRNCPSVSAVCRNRLVLKC